MIGAGVVCVVERDNDRGGGGRVEAGSAGARAHAEDTGQPGLQKLGVSVNLHTKTKLAAILFLASLLSGCVSKPTSPATVGEFIKAKQIAYESLIFIDEPPGKLVALRASDCVIFIEFNSALFSAERNWDRCIVEAATILKAEVYPLGIKGNPFGKTDASENSASF